MRRKLNRLRIKISSRKLVYTNSMCLCLIVLLCISVTIVRNCSINSFATILFLCFNVFSLRK